MKEEKHTVNSTDSERRLDKIQQTFMRKTLNKRASRKNPQATAYLIVKKLKAFLYSRIRQRFPLLPLLFNIVLEFLARRIRQKKKRNIGHPYTDDMIVYIENSK